MAKSALAKTTTQIVNMVSKASGSIGAALGIKPKLIVETGFENRPDNVEVPKDFFFIDVVNNSRSSVTISDVGVVHRNPSRYKSVKSVIIKEARTYPLAIAAKSSLRIHLLAPQVDIDKLDYVAVKTGTGREIRGQLQG